MLIDSYLNFLDEAKYEKKAERGELSPADLKRIRKFKQREDPLALKAKGIRDPKEIKKLTKKKKMIKPAEKYYAGIRKGTKAIRKKEGIKTQAMPDVEYTKAQINALTKAGVPAARAAALVQKKAGLKVGQKITRALGAHGTIRPSGKAVVHEPEKPKKGEEGLHAIVGRHETDEGKEAKKVHKKEKKIATVAGFVHKHKKTGAPAGVHYTRQVLRRERPLVQRAMGLYKGKGGVKKLAKYRQASGEYEDVPTKGSKAERKKEAGTRRMIRTGMKYGTIPAPSYIEKKRKYMSDSVWRNDLEGIINE